MRIDAMHACAHTHTHARTHAHTHTLVDLIERNLQFFLSSTWVGLEYATCTWVVVQ